ncbi:MAG TPA: rod shape-determining protein MreD [Polyangia bacterium]
MNAQRAIVMTLAVYVGLIVTSSLQALSPWRVPTPEVALLVVLYLGLGGRGSAPSLLGLALVIGYLADLFAGSPKGLESLTLGVAMLLARAASSRLDVATPWHTMVIALVAALAHGLLQLAISSSMYGGDAVAALRLVPTTALTTALVAPFAFRILRRLDRRLAPDAARLRMT